MGEIIPDCPVTRNSSAFPTRAACSPPRTWSVPKHVNCHNPTHWGASQEALRLAGWRGFAIVNKSSARSHEVPRPSGKITASAAVFAQGVHLSLASWIVAPTSMSMPTTCRCIPPVPPDAFPKIESLNVAQEGMF